MMKKLILVGVIAIMAGCVVVPENQRYEVVMYPQYGGAYIWDSRTSSFYFVVNSNRYYMQPGWNPRHGYPKGKYKKY